MLWAEKLIPGKVSTSCITPIYKKGSRPSAGTVSSGGLAVKHPALGTNGHRFEPRNLAHLAYQCAQKWP
jgi:hypothetical protein